MIKPCRLFPLLAVALTQIATLQSCETDVIYDRYEHIETECWDRSDTLFYNIPPVKKTGSYAFTVGLRTDSDFPFIGLGMVVERVVKPGNIVVKDTLKCIVADNKGNITGRGTGCYQYDYGIPPVSLHRGDSLHIIVRHIMRRETLPGVKDIGIKMTTTDTPPNSKQTGRK